jgi:hypothetical protein
VNSIFLLILLWSTTIGDEPEIRLPEPAEKVNAKTKLPLGKQAKALDRISAPDVTFHRKVFLDSFAIQADEGELRTCLNEWHPSPAALVLSADMTPHGKLRNFTVINNSDSLPDCASKVLESMVFDAKMLGLKKSNVTVKWRVDW